MEQALSAGAVALGLLNAALAAGWGASWLTGWPAYDRTLVEGELGLAPEEWIAGFVYIGSAGAAARPAAPGRRGAHHLAPGVSLLVDLAARPRPSSATRASGGCSCARSG